MTQTGSINNLSSDGTYDVLWRLVRSRPDN